MSYAAYLRIDGVRGECTTPRHVGEIEILSHAFGGVNGQKIMGSASGKWVIYDGGAVGFVSVLKRIDSTSGKLAMMVSSGAPVKTVTFTAEQLTKGGSLRATHTILLTDVRLMSVRPSASDAGNGLSEELEFDAENIYAKYKDV